MSQPLPKGGFKWLSEREISLLDIFQVADDAAQGYSLEVDLIIPPHLHDFFNDYPLCPESKIPPGGKQKKLLQTLHNKQKYISHYRNLKQCLKLGIEIENVHRVLEFDQSLWLRPYTDLNTNLRNLATNEFYRSLFKLFINSVFGKTMEAVEKRVNIHLLSHFDRVGARRGVQDLISKATFKSASIFTDQLAAIQLTKTSIYYNKPIYTGFAVLDVSVVRMIEFYYGYLKQVYRINVGTLYSDTDSLLLEVQTQNFYQDMKAAPQKF